MPIERLLIANRGEIAIRIARAAAELGIETVAVYAQDDASSLHVRRADRAIELPGAGVRAYLDIEAIVAAAQRTQCDAVHPGYGFLSESAAFADACHRGQSRFVGPSVETLELFGDKAQARAFAQRLDVPVIEGTGVCGSLADALGFFRSLGPAARAVIKAVAGGGGRGMRVVASEDELVESYARCQSEAAAAFGAGDVYVERLFPHARHIEVQVLGDGRDVAHLYERECTLQRRHQKLIEIAPSPSLSQAVRERVLDAAVRMARAARFSNAGTFEFLIDAGGGDSAAFVFIEANARLQVEHTVTEEVLGVDIVHAQLRLAAGATLHELGLSQSQISRPRGAAVQARVNMETLMADGSTKPASGALTAFEPPSGRGVRVETYGYPGYRTHSGFDSLLAKVIAHAPDGAFPEAARRLHRALAEFRIEGVATNLDLLRTLLRDPDVIAGAVDTTFIERRIDRLAAPLSQHILDSHSDGTLQAPLQGTIVSIEVACGDLVRQGQTIVVMEAMKMEHVIAAATSGRVRRIAVSTGDAVLEGAALAEIEPIASAAHIDVQAEIASLDYLRSDLDEVENRRARVLDEARPAAVAKRRSTQQRTARENIADLCDPGTFVEYGPLVLAAQRARRSLDELIEKSPADGMVVGVGSINGALFGDPRSRCAVMAYDYTVFAGTQGARNHAKTDRLLKVAQDARMPLVLFAEGGGGRPGDTESSGDAGGTPTFGQFAELSGLVPSVGIASGRCFAGNASLLGCCDVVIATGNSNIGMGGPAMVEGGGLGVFAPEQIGPFAVQLANGVTDVGVRDEAEAVKVAKQYLSYFQGALATFEAPDQRQLRHSVPENRLRVYNVRAVIETLADKDSVLELRREFARVMVTALVRIEGRSVGVIANNPQHLGGAIDSDGADKAARFMQLCDAFDIPILFLCDTPGIMVGPEIEKTALVRHSSRMFLIGASLTTPFFTIVLRKAYGLGALAMAGGSFKRPMACVAWPTGEFGGMGLEGAVKLAYRKELDGIAHPDERKRKYEELVAKLYEHGKALSIATIFGVDDVIDPADSRRWLTNLLVSVRPAPPRAGKKRPAIDAW